MARSLRLRVILLLGLRRSRRFSNLVCQSESFGREGIENGLLLEHRSPVPSLRLRHRQVPFVDRCLGDMRQFQPVDRQRSGRP